MCDEGEDGKGSKGMPTASARPNESCPPGTSDLRVKLNLVHENVSTTLVSRTRITTEEGHSRAHFWGQTTTRLNFQTKISQCQPMTHHTDEGSISLKYPEHFVYNFSKTLSFLTPPPLPHRHCPAPSLMRNYCLQTSKGGGRKEGGRPHS